MKLTSVKAYKPSIIITCCILATCISSPFYAQSPNDSVLTFFKVGVELKYGAILPHNQSVKYLVSEPVKGFDLSFSRRTSGEKPWQTFYHNPVTGFGIHYLNLGNNEQLGNAFAVYALSDFYFSTKPNGLNMHYGYGISYISKPFNEKTNYYNIAIGSRFNVYFKLALCYSFEVNNLTLRPFISFIHYSNGSVNKPNLGLNILNSGFAVRFPVKKYISGNQKEFTIPEYQKKWISSVSIGTGIHQKNPPLSPHYPVVTMRYEIENKYSQRHSLGAGSDITYYRFVSLLEEENANPFRNGIYILYNSFFNKIVFSAQTGIYTFKKFSGDGKIYNRIGMSYSFSEIASAGIFLKSHLFVADFVELSFTYSIVHK